MRWSRSILFTFRDGGLFAVAPIGDTEMLTTTELRGPMSRPRPTDPIGSIGWTERTGGVLTARECLTLARPLLRGELGILAGRLAMELRRPECIRSAIATLARSVRLIPHSLGVKLPRPARRRDVDRASGG